MTEPATIAPAVQSARAQIQPARRQRRRAEAGSYPLFLLVALAVLAVLVGPLLVGLLRSLQSGTDVTSPLSWDMLGRMTFANYGELLGGASDILPYVGNSVIVAAGTALVATVAGGLAGYVFARFRFRGMNAIFLTFLTIFMVPFQAVVIPLLALLDRLHLANSWAGLILVHSTYALPFCIFIMRNTFIDIPIEIEEAARVDGATARQ